MTRSPRCSKPCATKRRPCSRPARSASPTSSGTSPGSRYHQVAEQVARDAGLSYDLLLNVYDRSIIEVENRPPGENLGRKFDRALDRTIAAADVPESESESVAARVRAALNVDLEEAYLVGTGYGRVTLPFSKEHIRSEILCHGLGAHVLFPETRTVLDIGGQDTKAIQVDRHGIVENFQMNDRCAAGCGRYLGYIADEMNMGLHELGPMAMTATRAVRINSTCTVFAGAELRDRLALGEKRADVLAGLHRAVVLRAMSIISRSGGIQDQFTFTGGVAKTRRRPRCCGISSRRTTATSRSTSARKASIRGPWARPPSPTGPSNRERRHDHRGHRRRHRGRQDRAVRQRRQ